MKFQWKVLAYFRPRSFQQPQPSDVRQSQRLRPGHLVQQRCL